MPDSRRRVFFDTVTLTTSPSPDGWTCWSIAQVLAAMVEHGFYAPVHRISDLL